MKTKKPHLPDTKAARLHNGGNLGCNCQGYKIGDNGDGTVETGLNFFLFQEMYDTSATRREKSKQDGKYG